MLRIPSNIKAAYYCLMGRSVVYRCNIIAHMKSPWGNEAWGNGLLLKKEVRFFEIEAPFINAVSCFTRKQKPE